jgi:hypothetical protein
VVHRSGEKAGGKGKCDTLLEFRRSEFREYREAWHLLREAAGMEEETAAPHPEESAAEEVAMGAGLQRVQNSFDFFRRRWGWEGRSLRMTRKSRSFASLRMTTLKEFEMRAGVCAASTNYAYYPLHRSNQ